MGCDGDGRLRAIEGTLEMDSGAYIHSGGSVMFASLSPFGKLYAADGVDVNARLVDTSKLAAGAFRGYGAPQTTFPLECLMDELAESLDETRSIFGSRT